jgi:hypothetical protein
MKEIEDRAHKAQILLSSDAIRHFISVSKSESNQFAYLDQVIAKAKATYPTEDNWVVLDLTRMQSLLSGGVKPTITKVDSDSTINDYREIKTTVGVGSLAEAILYGNVMLALALIKDRPMVALAEATADLDAAYRQRLGLPVIDASISELLKTEAENYTTEELENIIRALTSAIDGTFTDELSAVKIAIAKAISLAKK